MKGLGRSQTASVSDGRIYKLDFKYIDDVRKPIVNVYNASDYKLIKEFPIEVLMPEGIKLKMINNINRGELFLSTDGFFYLVYDIGNAEFVSEASGYRTASGQMTFSFTTVNRTVDMAKSSFLVCQKLSKTLKTVGLPKSLMDQSIPGKKYTTQVLPNEDNSAFIVYQSEEFYSESLKYAAGIQKIMLYDNSFTLKKTFDLKDYRKYKKADRKSNCLLWTNDFTYSQ
jgi:hypothetical protein